MAINLRLQRLLDQKHASYAVLPHNEVFTAQEIAESTGVPGCRFAKVVVVRDGSGRDVMAVLPASRTIDLDAMHRLTGRVGFRIEVEHELARLFPDCEVGTMPPFGNLYQLPMYVDPCLLAGGDVFFQAGNHREVILMRCDEYRRIAGPYRADFCLHAGLESLHRGERTVVTG